MPSVVWSAMCVGVLLCATSPEARARLGAAFAGDSSAQSAADGAERAVEKQYLALVDGWPAADAGVVETPIGRVEYGVRGGLHAASPTGKPCESRWTVVRRNPDDTSVLAVTIRTGKPYPVDEQAVLSCHQTTRRPTYHTVRLHHRGQSRSSDVMDKGS